MKNQHRKAVPFICAATMGLLSDSSVAETFPPSSCDPKALTNLIGSYDFSGDLDEKFSDHPDWQDNPNPGVINDAKFYQRNQRLELDVPSASKAASEAWRTWKTQLPSDKNWKIQADIVLPLVWNKGKDEDQIGAGLFVGKPGGYTVYEVDFITVAEDKGRAVLAMNIHNRRGGDPNYVGKDVDINVSAIQLEVMYCNDDKALTVYYDGEHHVDTQPITDEGVFDWEIGPVFDVGMIGFSEGPAARENFPYLDNWAIYE